MHCAFQPNSKWAKLFEKGREDWERKSSKQRGEKKEGGVFQNGAVQARLPFGKSMKGVVALKQTLFSQQVTKTMRLLAEGWAGHREFTPGVPTHESGIRLLTYEQSCCYRPALGKVKEDKKVPIFLPGSADEQHCQPRWQTSAGKELCFMLPNTTGTHQMLNTKTGIALKKNIELFLFRLGLSLISQYELCSCQLWSLQLQLFGSYVTAEVIKGPREWRMHFLLGCITPALEWAAQNAVETSSIHSRCPSLPLLQQRQKVSLEEKKKIQEILDSNRTCPSIFQKPSCKQWK